MRRLNGYLPPRNSFSYSCTATYGGVPCEATVFELEGSPDDTVKIRLDDKTVAMTLAEAMGRSRIVDFMDEAAERARRDCGIDPDALGRPDHLYFFGHKSKIHRAIPETGFTAAMDYTDTDPPAGTNVYRVRVTQRNGQAAWSSPIWVQNG